MNPKNKISVFDTITDTNPASEISVFNFCIKVMSGKYYQQLKAIRNEPDKKRRAELKKQLPAFTISGTFANPRKDATLVNHSGFICIDIDKDQNQHVKDWGGLRDRLLATEVVYFSSLSASGNGVFAIIPIKYPERHRDHFKALQDDFKSILGITLDPSGINESRLRFISADGLAKFNVNAKEYRAFPRPKEEKRRAFRPTTEDIFARAVLWVERKGLRFVDGSKHNYLLNLSRRLQLAGVPYNETENFVHNNFIDRSQIKSNCLTYPYFGY